jgi:hypothetical protein
MPISSLSCLQAYLSDPYDVAAMIEICKTTMKLTESPSWQQALGKQFVHPSTPDDLEINSVRFTTANCRIIDHFLHLNRDWSPRCSTLRDKTAGFEPKRPEI